MPKIVDDVRALTAGLKVAADQAQRARQNTLGVAAAQRTLSPPLAIQEEALARQRARRAASVRLREMGLA